MTLLNAATAIQDQLLTKVTNKFKGNKKGRYIVEYACPNMCTLFKERLKEIKVPVVVVRKEDDEAMYQANHLRNTCGDSLVVIFEQDNIPSAFATTCKKIAIPQKLRTAIARLK